MAAAGKGKVSKFAVWAILGLLVAGLAGFGTTQFSGSAQRVASVGGRDITVHQYARALQQDLRALQAQTGQSIPLSQARLFGLDRQVLQRLIATAALDAETLRFGLSVGDVQVRNQILEISAFTGTDGNFDREAYRFALERVNMNEAQFEDDIRIETARTLLQGAVLGGLAAPETFTQRLLGYVAESRDFTWAQLGVGDLITGIPVPSETDLAAYHVANEAEFTLPEAKAITFAWLTPDMILDDVVIDEDELRTAYDDRSDEYNRPERRLVERLVYGTEEQAAAARARIDSGEVTFDNLVAEFDLELADVDLGDVEEADLGEAGAAIFALTEPGITGPNPSDLGPALYRMNAIIGAVETSFEDARPELQEELATGRARRQIADEVEAIDDLLAGGATLEELAAETPMILGQIEWSPDSDTEIAGYEAFRSAAAALGADDIPEVFEMEDGGIFTLRLDETIPPRLQPLADVRDSVAAGWEAAETGKRLAELANSLAPQISAGTSMAALGQVETVEDGLTREAFIDGAPAELLIEAFEMNVGEVRVIEAEASALIVRLDAIHVPDVSDPETALVERAIDEQTSQSLAQDVLEAFTRAVQAEAGISINQPAINAVHTQFP